MGLNHISFDTWEVSLLRAQAHMVIIQSLELLATCWRLISFLFKFF